MKRRILLLLVALMVATPLVASAVGIVVVKKKAAAYTDDLLYNADHATDTETAYTVNRTGSIAGTEDGTITQPVGGTDPGSASADGGNVIKFNSWAASIWFSTTTSIFNPAVGLMEFEFYGPVDAQQEIFRSWNSTGPDYTYRLYVQVTALGKLSFSHLTNNGGAVSCVATSTDSVPSNTWTGSKLYVRWSQSGNTCGVKVGSGSWVDATPESGWNTGTITNDRFQLGMDQNGWGSTPVYLDGFKIWTTYDGT